MADSRMITKRVAISKTNAQMVGVVAAASFISIFCLVASHAVLSQNSYLARVTTAKEKANQQLKTNIQVYNNLTTTYQAFIAPSNNVLGGLSSGSGNNDGDNAKIILDALPPSYDFPAMVTSVEKILTNNSLKISGITGTDDQLSQQNNSSSPNPQPVTMPFSFSVSSATYTSVGQLITSLQQSIRPIQIDTIDLSGAATDMGLTLNAHTYYQPSKSISITTKVVK